MNLRRAAKAQQTHCVHGHAFTPENTRIKSNGCRACRVCQDKRNAAFCAARSKNMNAIRIENMAAQGDVLFRRINKLPSDVVEQPRKGALIVAHSETGHDHTINDREVKLFERAERDPMICYLSVAGDCAEVVHHRPHDTHRTICLTQGNWEVRRQREWTPEGLRRVED